MRYCLIYVFSGSPCETAQVYCSSLLLKFTCKFYPPPIEHRSMEYHYTKEVSHIPECTYTLARCTPTPIDHRCMEYHYTQYISHIEECIYTHGRQTPCNQPYIHVTPLHPISFTYRRMHIYQWQMYHLPPLDNRPVLHHDTQEIAHIKECTYTHGRWPPPINQKFMEYCYTK